MTNGPPTYDLLTCPWIPVEWLDVEDSGQPDKTERLPEVGLADALRDAHQIRSVVEASPLVVFGIYRLLGAVLHAYVTLPDGKDWERRLERPRLEGSEVERIIGRLESRMDLFHPERPFYQSGDIPLNTKPGPATKSVGYLAAEAPTGTNVTHFGHAGEGDHAFCPPCCARGLVTLPPFAIAGGAGIRPGLNGTPPTYVLPVGPNLAATLWLNYLTPPFRKGPWTNGPARPLWEEPDGRVERGEHGSIEFVQSLTWAPRRVRLLPGTGGECSRCGRASDVLVRQMVFGQGRSRTPGSGTWIDPWAAYIRPKPKGGVSQDLVPVRPREARDLWRDLAPLFLAVAAGEPGEDPPQVVEQVADTDAGETPSFELFALRTDMKAKVFEWRHDRITLPHQVLDDENAAAAVRAALQIAEAVETAIRAGLRQLHPALERGTPDANTARAALQSLAGGVQRAYWSSLEAPFRRHLLDQGLLAGRESAEHQGWHDRWRQTACTAAERVFFEVLRGFHDDARSLKHAVVAERVFCGRLRRLKGGRR